MNKKRFFTSIDLPSDIKDVLKVIQIPNIYWLRWMSSNNYHITLNFLGDLSSDQIDVAKAIMTKVAGNNKPINIKMDKIIAKQDMLWLIPSDTEDLFYLQSELKNELRNSHIGNSERRPYNPHILLAKSKKHGRKVASHKGSVYNADKFKPFIFKADYINLYESRLTPESATHILVERYQLNG